MAILAIVKLTHTANCATVKFFYPSERMANANVTALQKNKGDKESKSGKEKSTNAVNFLDLLVRKIPYEYKLKKYKFRKTIGDLPTQEIDDSYRFRNTTSYSNPTSNTLQALTMSKVSTMKNFVKKLNLEKELLKQHRKLLSQRGDEKYAIEVLDWEKNVLPWHQIEMEDECQEQVGMKEYVNSFLSQKWEMNLFNDPASKVKDYMTLYLEDNNMIFEKIDEKKKSKNRKKLASEKNMKNKYNISNDKYYSTETKDFSLMAFGVQHSPPALRLDKKFYKINTPSDELRYFHKPILNLPKNEYPIVTSLQNRHGGRKRGDGKGITSGNELSCSDHRQFAILEYAEENPLFITNPGMVSLLSRYYRKTESEDDHAPEGVVALEPDEDDPFYGFSDIKGGTYVDAIVNNLYISPVYANSSSDYLCIVMDEHIVARAMDNIYVVGQEFPKDEVFAPHSRKLNIFCKDRLKVAAHRVFSKGKALLMTDLDEMFPYFSDGSKRKWLKEYADSVKKGRDNVWVLKDGQHVMDEEEAQRLITPENICQYESMLATEQMMNDMGVKYTEGDEDDDGKCLQRWSLSRNFINAANGRGLLELVNKEISPGRADGADGDSAENENEIFFSFRRLKLKKGNEAENRKIVNEHQSMYKTYIEKIWNAQIDFLMRKEAQEHQQRKLAVHSKGKSDEAQPMVIRRTYFENGEKTVQEEAINDGHVINAYLKARKKTGEKKNVMTCSNCGQTGHMKTNKCCPKYINVIKASKKKYENEKKRAKSYLQDTMGKILTRCMGIPFSNAFHRPVSAKKFPTYYQVVTEPIDLTTMKNRVKLGHYKSFSSFIGDLRLMRSNCILFNGQGHSLTEIADEICAQAESFGNKNIETIQQAESLMNESTAA